MLSHKTTPDSSIHSDILGLIEKLKRDSMSMNKNSATRALYELYQKIAVEKHNNLSKENLLDYFHELAVGIDEYNHNVWMRTAWLNKNTQTSTAIRLWQVIINGLIEKDGPLDDVLPYLNQQDNEGWTLGMYVARYQKPEDVQAYLKILALLLEKGVAAEKILTHLGKQSNDDWTLGMFVIKNTKTSICDVIALIIKLAERKVDRHKIAVLLNQKQDGMSLVDILLEKPDQHVFQLYQLLRLGLIPESSCHQIKNFKQLIVSAIKSMPDNSEKLQAISEACGEHAAANPVYQQLSQPSGSKALRFLSRRSHHHPELDDLQQELARLSVILRSDVIKSSPYAYPLDYQPWNDKSLTAKMLQNMQESSPASLATVPLIEIAPPVAASAASYEEVTQLSWGVPSVPSERINERSSIPLSLGRKPTYA